ncbi:hypothetical protein JL721_12369 [Aureococcus anophagefferens]|nr:hypothetical protein JL721_12369 [Aureococcus anophagefferens]
MALFQSAAVAGPLEWNGLASDEHRAALRIAHSPALGRHLVAARAFTFGEVVLAEKATLAWETGATNDSAARAFLAACVAADDATMKRVRALYHARPSAAAARLRLAQATTIACDALGAPEDVAALLLRLDANAHGYDAAAGGLELTATRAIAAGEVVAFSYLGNARGETAAARAAELERKFDFACACDRCAASDAATSAGCPKNCGGYASLKAGDPPGGRLLCARCGVLEPKSARTVYAAEALKREAIDEMRDADVDLDTSPADDLAYVMNATHALVEECARDLSRRHELTRAARGLLKTVLAALLRRHRPDEGQFAFLVNAYVANDLDVTAIAAVNQLPPGLKTRTRAEQLARKYEPCIALAFGRNDESKGHVARLFAMLPKAACVPCPRPKGAAAETGTPRVPTL